MSKWNIKEGDAISAGDIVCEIETDKAVVDYEATDDMFLAKILIPEGTENVPVGQPMMVVVDEEDSLAAFEDFKLEEASEPPAAPSHIEAKPAQKENVPMDMKAQDGPKSLETKTTNVSEASFPPPHVAAPIAKTTASSSTPSTAFLKESWGFNMKNSATSTSLLKRQQAYIAQYGLTGMTPVVLPETKN